MALPLEALRLIHRGLQGMKCESQRVLSLGYPDILAAPEQEEASWQDIMPVDTLGLEVGYRLIPLVDKMQDGELLKRIKAIRRKFAQEIGFLPPAIPGVGKIIETWQDWAKAIPDSKATFVREFASGDTAVFELVWKGVHTGPLQTPTGTIPASNKPIEVPAWPTAGSPREHRTSVCR